MGPKRANINPTLLLSLPALTQPCLLRAYPNNLVARKAIRAQAK